MQSVSSRLRDRPGRLMATVAVVALVIGAVAFHDLPGTAAASPTPVNVAPPTASQALPASYTAPPTLVDRGLAYGLDPSNHLDLYLPESRPAGLLPVIVFLHSGGWVAGTRANVLSVLLRQVSRDGVALASVDYRLASRNRNGSVNNAFPAAPEDVDRAVRWIKAMAPAFGLDPTRIILAGDSAGGQLAALAAAAPGAFAEPGLPPALAAQDPAVAGVIDLVGPSDLAAMAATGGYGAGLETDFLGCAAGRPATCDPALVEAARVATHLSSSAPPAFLAYGRFDTLVVDTTQGRPLADAWALARGPGDRGVWYDDANDGHNLSPATINVSALERWLDEVLAGSFR